MAISPVAKTIPPMKLGPSNCLLGLGSMVVAGAIVVVTFGLGVVTGIGVVALVDFVGAVVGVVTGGIGVTVLVVGVVPLVVEEAVVVVKGFGVVVLSGSGLTVDGFTVGLIGPSPMFSDLMVVKEIFVVRDALLTGLKLSTVLESSALPAKMMVKSTTTIN